MERHSEYPGILNTGIGLITALVLDETRKLQKVRNPGKLDVTLATSNASCNDTLTLAAMTP